MNDRRRGSCYRETFTKPVPAGAEAFTRKVLADDGTGRRVQKTFLRWRTRRVRGPRRRVGPSGPARPRCRRRPRVARSGPTRVDTGTARVPPAVDPPRRGTAQPVDHCAARLRARPARRSGRGRRAARGRGRRSSGCAAAAHARPGAGGTCGPRSPRPGRGRRRRRTGGCPRAGRGLPNRPVRAARGLGPVPRGPGDHARRDGGRPGRPRPRDALPRRGGGVAAARRRPHQHHRATHPVPAHGRVACRTRRTSGRDRRHRCRCSDGRSRCR